MPASVVPEASLRAGHYRHLREVVLTISAERARRRGPDRGARPVGGPHDRLALGSGLRSGNPQAPARAGEAEVLHVAHESTFVRIGGKQMYLFRAVDSYGQTVDFYVSETRDREAAKLFLRKALANPDNRPP